MSYVNEKSVLAIGILFPVLGLVAVALRFAVRYQRKVSFGVDDWLCLPAVVSAILPSDDLGLMALKRLWWSAPAL